MALFTDGQLNGAIDLQNHENHILDVASSEGIDLAGKIALAQDEIANELLMFLLKRLPTVESHWLPQPATRQKTGVNDVAVTTPLRQWHAHKTLALVYRDAYNNQLNDRYRGKWNEYEQLATTSFRNYLRIGVGLVASPIPKAAPPLVSTFQGDGPGATYYAAVAWVNQSGQEGAVSDVVQITTQAGQQLTAVAINPPVNAAGWNVYLGEAPSKIYRQNTAALGIGNSWSMPGPLSMGAEPSGGQQPTWYLADQKVVERG